MRLIRTTLACVAAAGLLAACSSSTGGKGHSTDNPSSTGGATVSAPTTAQTPIATDTAGGSDDSASATAALLAASDITGGTFTESPYVADQSPPPCEANGQPLDKRVPPKVTVGRDLDQETPAAFIEEQYKIYADEATAERALAEAKAGLACTSGTSYNDDGTTDTITITGPEDATSALGSDVTEAYSWSVKNTTVTGAAVAIRIKDRLVLLTFAAAADTDTSSLPDATTVAKTAVAKVIAGS